jgi:hypothetical protein
MYMLFAGMGTSVVLGMVGGAAVYLVDGPTNAQQFLRAYTREFRTLVSLGLILGTALIVYKSQDLIASTIEAAFPRAELVDTEYDFSKRRLYSHRRTVLFSGELLAIAFPLFYYCRFPLTGIGEDIMIAVACLQYVLGSYVGRKLRYAGMMIHALANIPVKRNLFRGRELDSLNTYVNVASSLTVVFVYAHVLGYYTGPFKFDSFLGESIKPLLLLPAVIATPVLLIFNFYPRAVLRKVYRKSIEVEVKNLRAALRSEKVSAFEKRSHLMEFDKMCREELRHNLQLRLSDLPIAITIIVGLVQMLVKD